MLAYKLDRVYNNQNSYNKESPAPVRPLQLPSHQLPSILVTSIISLALNVKSCKVIRINRKVFRVNTIDGIVNGIKMNRIKNTTAHALLASNAVGKPATGLLRVVSKCCERAVSVGGHKTKS